MKPPICLGCPLYGAQGPVMGEGPSDAKVVFVGEAPGADEVRRRRPFVGRAGVTFDIALKAAGVSRSLVYITNVVKCMPPKKGQPWTFRKPTAREIEFCMARHLRAELSGLQPTVVVALGDVPCNAIPKDGVKREITKWRGTVLDIEAADQTPFGEGTC